MSCRRFNFEKRTCTQVDIGMDFIKTLTYTLDDGTTPIDITGYTFSMRIRQNKDDADSLTLGMVLNTTDTGFYVADPATGVIRLKITDTDTSSFTSGDYLYDIIVTDDVGDKSIFMEGKINLSAGVI